jgi:HK97 family phage portal protein
MIGEALSGTANPSQWLVDWVRGGQATTSGIRVDEDKALNYSAVWAASRLLTEGIASLPCIVYRRLPNGGHERAPFHPLYRLLHDEPNPEMDSLTFWVQQAMSVINWGNCYAEIERTVLTGDVFALYPLHPKRVKPYRDVDGRIKYEVRDEVGQPRSEPIPAERMFHVAGALSEDGITGKGVIEQARESIGLGLATETFGAAFFGNGAYAGVVFEHPGPEPLSDEAYERLKNSWNDRHQGAENYGKTAILEEGTKANKIGVPPEDAQFLETRQHNINEIARWYGVPPHLLAELAKGASYASIYEQNWNYLVHSLRPWLIRFERAIVRQLLKEDEKHELYVEFLVDAILRADPKTRAEANQIKLMNGSLTIDEWRAMENQNPLPHGLGKLHWMQLNMAPIETVITANGKEEPKQEAPSDVEKETRDDMSINIANAFLRDALLRALRIEANAAKRAAKDPSTFLPWLDKFYGRHIATVQAIILPAICAQMRAFGETGPAEPNAQSGAERHVATSRAQLLQAAECRADELLNSVSRCVRTWETERYPENGDSSYALQA